MRPTVPNIGGLRECIKHSIVQISRIYSTFKQLEFHGFTLSIYVDCINARAFQYVGGMFVERNGFKWMLGHDFEYFGFYIRPQYFSNSLSW